MNDYSSELPIRSQYPGQVLPDDVIVKLGDGTNPTTQFANVDVHGSLQTRIADAAGDIMGSQSLSSSFWLQTVPPSNGTSAPGTAASYADLIAGEYSSTLPTLTTGQQSAVQVNQNGILLSAPVTDGQPSTQTITAQDSSSTSTTVANGQVFVTGTPTAGSAASFAISTQETVKVEVTGTWTGTLSVEQSFDGGTTWVQSGVHQVGTAYNSNNFTSNFLGGTNVSGCTNFRVRSTTAWTGTATVRVVESVTLFTTYISNPVKLVDAATNSELNILAASTAASVTNTSAVVALSPNTPLPAGTNNIGFTNSNLYVSSAPVTVLNPVPVAITSQTVGTPIQNYQTSTNLAAGASVTLTYTVPSGHTFSLERIWASCSARIEVLVIINGTNAYTGFNSSASPNIDITVTAPPTIPSTGTVAVTFTNLDHGASNVYLTVEGNQVS